MLTDLVARLRALVSRQRIEDEIDEELRFHFDWQVETYQQAGLDRAEAVRRARLEFGGLDQIKSFRSAPSRSFAGSIRRSTRPRQTF